MPGDPDLAGEPAAGPCLPRPALPTMSPIALDQATGGPGRRARIDEQG